MGKQNRQNDESRLFGLSGAAAFLQCAQNTVLNHCARGTLAHMRDDTGRRIFTLAELRKFKRSGKIPRRAPVVH